MPLTPTVSVAAFIKEATQEAHSLTEQMLLPHLTGLHDRAGYARLLGMFYGFFHPLEQLILQHVTDALLPDIAERRNSGFILLDLQWLGSKDLPALATRLPQVDSVPRALGALYVLEGSTLGGRMIANMLRKNPALELGEEHLHFFNGYREQTGPKWMQFLSVLNAHEEHMELMAESARSSFDRLSDWIQQTLTT
jgi:heme oxygenase (biliverdin-IX-beta and delta-forming)